jgi:hypothetical protein
VSVTCLLLQQWLTEEDIREASCLSWAWSTIKLAGGTNLEPDYGGRGPNASALLTFGSATNYDQNGGERRAEGTVVVALWAFCAVVPERIHRGH